MDYFNVFLEDYSTEIIGGLIVSLLLLVSNSLQKFLKNFVLSKKYSGYIGEYYMYSFASSGEDKITCTPISIQMRLGKLAISAESAGVYKYKGGSMLLTGIYL